MLIFDKANTEDKWTSLWPTRDFYVLHCHLYAHKPSWTLQRVQQFSLQIKWPNKAISPRNINYSWQEKFGTNYKCTLWQSYTCLSHFATCSMSISCNTNTCYNLISLYNLTVLFMKNNSHFYAQHWYSANMTQADKKLEKMGRGPYYVWRHFSISNQAGSRNTESSRLLRAAEMSCLFD